MTQSNLTLSSASGHSLNVIGTANIEFSMGKLKLKFPFTIVDNLSRNCILGKDFLGANSARIYFDLNAVKVKGHYVPLEDDLAVASVVRLCKKVVLKPQTSYKLPGKVKLHPLFKENQEYMIGSIDKGFIYQEPFLHVSNSLVTLGQGRRVPLLLTNYTNKTIQLKRGCVVAKCIDLESLGGEIAEVSSCITDERKLPKHSEPNQFEPKHSYFSLNDINAPKENVLELRKLVGSYSDIFAKSEFDLGKYPHKRVKLSMESGQVVNKKMYRLPFNDRPLLKQKLDEMLESEIIRPSHSEFSNPFLLIDKKDGTKRLCLDFRLLNKLIKPTSYPLPRVDDILASLNGAKYFSCLDLANSYHQIELDPKDRHKTAFRTPFGLFEWNSLPQGLSVSGGHFQAIMNDVLRGCEAFAFVYLDDILIFSSSQEEHFKHLQIVFEKLRQNCLKLKLKKCHFFKQSVKYLGHVVTADGIIPDDDKVEALKRLETPRNLRDVRSFLGACGYYRKFLKHYAEITAPLTRLTQKNVPFVWDEACENSFQEVIRQLSKLPTLSHPDFSKPYVLYTDASDKFIAGVLCQSLTGQQEDELPVYFYSHRLSKSQVKQPIIVKEAIAVDFGVRKLHCYLHGAVFKVKTDHKPISFLLKSDFEKNIILQRIALQLSNYNCTIEYIPGRLNKVADFLSRPVSLQAKSMQSTGQYDSSPGNTAVNPALLIGDSANTGNRPIDSSSVNLSLQSPEVYTVDQASSNSIRDNHIHAINSQHINPKALSNLHDRPMPIKPDILPNLLVYDMHTEQLIDEGLSKLIKRVQTNSLTAHENRQFVIKDGVLHFISNPDDEPQLRIYVPQHLRQIIVHSYHEIGHPGSKRLYSVIKQNYYWPNLMKDAVKFVENCVPCQSVNLKQIKSPLQESSIPRYPFAEVSIDCCGPYTTTASKNKYLVCFICQYSGWLEVVPTRDITSETILDAFYEYIFWRYSQPIKVLTDNGGCFVSKIFTETMKDLRINHVRTTPFRPQSNSIQERSHATLNSILVKIIKDNPTAWDNCLGPALGGLRFNVSGSRQFSPYYLLFGRDPILPIDTLMGKRLPYYGDSFHKEILQRNHKIYCEAFTNLCKSRDRRNKYANKGTVQTEFKVNDPVYYKNFYRKHKLTPKWIPYYRVIEVLGSKNLLIKNQLDNQIIKVHVDQIRKAPIEDWELPSQDEFNPRPVRNCRYIVPPQNSQDQGETESSTTDTDEFSQQTQISHNVADDRLSSGHDSRRNKRLLTRKVRNQRHFSSSSEERIPLRQLQARLRRSHFDRLTQNKHDRHNKSSNLPNDDLSNEMSFSSQGEQVSDCREDRSVTDMSVNYVTQLDNMYNWG